MRDKIAVGLVTLGLIFCLESEASGDKKGSKQAAGKQGIEDGMPETTQAGGTYLGALAGISFPGGSSKFAFGGTLGHKFTKEWGLGLYVTHWSTSIDTTAGESTTSNTVGAAEGSYYFPDVTGLRLGLKAGINFVGGSTTIPNASVVTDNAFTFGPHVGYDYQIAESLSFGGEFNILFQTQAGSDAVTNLLVALKYWF